MKWLETRTFSICCAKFADLLEIVQFIFEKLSVENFFFSGFMSFWRYFDLSFLFVCFLKIVVSFPASRYECWTCAMLILCITHLHSTLMIFFFLNKLRKEFTLVCVFCFLAYCGTRLKISLCSFLSFSLLHSNTALAECGHVVCVCQCKAHYQLPLKFSIIKRLRINKNNP